MGTIHISSLHAPRPATPGFSSPPARIRRVTLSKLFFRALDFVMAIVLFAWIKVVNSGAQMPFAQLLQKLAMAWNPLAVTVLTKMERLNA
jgi:hypothetical protein